MANEATGLNWTLEKKADPQLSLGHVGVERYEKRRQQR